ncbi:Iron permease [Mycena chlorophos]|uniref:Iron permease n=1 Tax=Mycena chlorophos TaxID=658473 RepID=A0A8H6TB76_MYCCL|nr:Iron permease [Mycena chlorophos]
MAALVVDPGFFTNADNVDMVLMRAAFCAAFNLIAADAWDGYVVGPYATNCGPLFHSTGTAVMSSSADSSSSVINTDWKVKGISGLWVGDLSIRVQSRMGGFRAWNRESSSVRSAGHLTPRSRSCAKPNPGFAVYDAKRACALEEDNVQGEVTGVERRKHRRYAPTFYHPAAQRRCSRASVHPFAVPYAECVVSITSFYEVFSVKVLVRPSAPGDILGKRTSLGGFISTAIYSPASIALIYYLPVYYQACFDDSIRSAVDFLPYDLLISLFAFLAGVATALAQEVPPPVFCAFGCGIFSLQHFWFSVQIPLCIASACSSHAPSSLFPYPRAAPPQHAASALALWTFTRSFFHARGIAIDGTVLENELNRSSKWVLGQMQETVGRFGGRAEGRAAMAQEGRAAMVRNGGRRWRGRSGSGEAWISRVPAHIWNITTNFLIGMSPITIIYGGRRASAIIPLAAISRGTAGDQPPALWVIAQVVHIALLGYIQCAKVKRHAAKYQASWRALVALLGEVPRSFPALLKDHIRCMPDPNLLPSKQAEARSKEGRRVRREADLIRQNEGPLVNTSSERWVAEEDKDAAGDDVADAGDEGADAGDDEKRAGESRRVMSWIWNATGTEETGRTQAELDDGSTLQHSFNLADIYFSAVRIEWCKAYARVRRWREEVRILDAEWSRYPRSLQFEVNKWQRRLSFLKANPRVLSPLQKEDTPALHAEMMEGILAYAAKQRDLYLNLVRRAEVVRTEAKTLNCALISTIAVLRYKTWRPRSTTRDVAQANIDSLTTLVVATGEAVQLVEGDCADELDVSMDSLNLSQDIIVISSDAPSGSEA